MRQRVHLITPGVDDTARAAAWGGHVAYSADLDGHVWEVAFNPFSTLGPNDEFQWGGA